MHPKQPTDTQQQAIQPKQQDLQAINIDCNILLGKEIKILQETRLSLRVKDEIQWSLLPRLIQLQETLVKGV